MRFHELAKKLGVEGKVLMERLSKEGVKIKSHMSTLTKEEETVAKKCAKDLNGGEKAKPAPKKKTAKKKPTKVVEEEPKEKVFLVKKTKPAPEKKVKEVVETPKKTATSTVTKEEVKEEVEETVEEEAEKSIEVQFPINLKDLAEKLDVKPNILITKLMNFGVFATINQKLDQDTATIVAHEFGVNLKAVKAPEVKPEVPEEKEEIILEPEPPLPFESPDKPEDLKGRTPVVTILGHVDHGKTSLLDKIRETNVVDSEKGGITQHIGAYRVVRSGKPITFLDTPGHEAFTAMRARGASVTDIAILVVAADDGIMPQTDEAIDHARAAEVPIIVAINKMDLPGASPDKIKRQLSERNLMTEDWGGETLCVPVSAATGEGIDSLLEMILLQTEMLELKANPNRLAYGTVVEAKLTTGRGAVTSVLVRKGTLRVGDPIVSGLFSGKVKAMANDLGQLIKEAGPSIPVEVLGLNGVPEPGADFFVCASDKEAKAITENRRLRERQKQMGGREQVTLEDIFAQIELGQAKTMNLILKTDVQGSREAIVRSIEGIPSEKVAPRLIHGGVGDISESDVMLAAASKSVVIGFHVRANNKVKDLAKKEGVEIRLYEIIYRVIEDVRKAMEGLLEPTFVEVVIGHAEVRQCFKISKVGAVAGCYLTDGTIRRNSKVRVRRGEDVIFEGGIASLKRFKDEVKEVKSGFECGLRLQNFDAIQESDIIEAFDLEKEETKLS